MGGFARHRRNECGKQRGCDIHQEQRQCRETDFRGVPSWPPDYHRGNEFIYVSFFGGMPTA